MLKIFIVLLRRSPAQSRRDGSNSRNVTPRVQIAGVAIKDCRIDVSALESWTKEV